MSAQHTRKALFSETNIPAGGVCLSSFVVLTNGSRILVGKMTQPKVWVEKFFVGEKFTPQYVASGKYLIPASHLAWYESPLEAAERILKEQVLLPSLSNRIRLVEVQSHVSGEIGEENRPPHWDICFVYQVEVSNSLAKKMKRPEWFEDFGFKPASNFSAQDFTRGHGDVLEMARMIGKKRRV